MANIHGTAKKFRGSLEVEIKERREREEDESRVELKERGLI